MPTLNNGLLLSMEVPEGAIKEFIDIYQEHFGRTLSTKEAVEGVYKILGLYKALYKTSEVLEIDKSLAITKDLHSPPETDNDFDF